MQPLFLIYPPKACEGNLYQLRRQEGCMSCGWSHTSVIMIMFLYLKNAIWFPLRELPHLWKFHQLIRWGGVLKKVVPIGDTQRFISRRMTQMRNAWRICPRNAGTQTKWDRDTSRCNMRGTMRDDQKVNIERYSIWRETIRKIHVVGKMRIDITEEVKTNRKKPCYTHELKLFSGKYYLTRRYILKYNVLYSVHSAEQWVRKFVCCSYFRLFKNNTRSPKEESLMMLEGIRGRPISHLRPFITRPARMWPSKSI